MPSRPQDPLRLHDIGDFEVLSKKPNPEGLIVVTYPLLDLLLPVLEREAGRKFTEAEIEEKVAKAPAVALPRQEAKAFVEASLKNHNVILRRGVSANFFGPDIE